MAVAKMSVAELEEFLRREFPQFFGTGSTVKIERADGETCLVREPFSERMLRPGGTVSGPTLMALADCAMYVVLLSAIGRPVVTDSMLSKFPVALVADWLRTQGLRDLEPAAEPRLQAGS